MFKIELVPDFFCFASFQSSLSLLCCVTQVKKNNNPSYFLFEFKRVSGQLDLAT